MYTEDHRARLRTVSIKMVDPVNTIATPEGEPRNSGYTDNGDGAQTATLGSDQPAMGNGDQTDDDDAPAASARGGDAEDPSETSSNLCVKVLSNVPRLFEKQLPVNT